VAKTHCDESIAGADHQLYIADVGDIPERNLPELNRESNHMNRPTCSSLERRPIPRRIGILSSSTLALFLLLLAMQASGHAILVRSTPKANEVVASGDLKLELEFNARVDAARSNLSLVLPGGETEKLELLPQPSPAILAAKATRLTPGAYSIRWQVLTNDGHITRGEIPFKVK
jgi:copper resistance protein C